MCGSPTCTSTSVWKRPKPAYSSLSAYARGRHQGAGRAQERQPRIGRVLGRPAARLCPPGHAGPGPGSRRRDSRLLEGPGRGLPPGIKGAGFKRQPTCSTLSRSRPSPAVAMRFKASTNAEGRDVAHQAIETFALPYGAKFPMEAVRLRTKVARGTPVGASVTARSLDRTSPAHISAGRRPPVDGRVRHAPRRTIGPARSVSAPSARGSCRSPSRPPR